MPPRMGWPDDRDRFPTLCKPVFHNTIIRTRHSDKQEIDGYHYKRDIAHEVGEFNRAASDDVRFPDHTGTSQLVDSVQESSCAFRADIWIVDSEPLWDWPGTDNCHDHVDDARIVGLDAL